jgi:hypothetical protein
MEEPLKPASKTLKSSSGNLTGLPSGHIGHGDSTELNVSHPQRELTD